MKQIIEAIIRWRRPAFRFDDRLSQGALRQFIRMQTLAVFRGMTLTLSGRAPKGMIRGRGVSFFNLGQIRWGRFLKLGDYVTLSALGHGNLSIGDNVSIGDFCKVVISTSLNHLGSHIHIGNNVGIGEYAYLGGAGGLSIGDDCIIGQYFSCHPENHCYDQLDIPIRLQGVSRKGIRIGANCWIGSKVTILDGVTLGKGCVVAAGAVVNRSFPDNSIIGGVPARLLRNREELAWANQHEMLEFVS